MKMRSDLLFSVTLAVAATSGALAQASHRQLRFRKRRSKASIPSCRVVRKRLATAWDTGNLQRICRKASGARHAAAR
jgi:hypothetical protein